MQRKRNKRKEIKNCFIVSTSNINNNYIILLNYNILFFIKWVVEKHVSGYQQVPLLLKIT